MMPSFETLYLDIAPPFAQIMLHRPHVKNAMNAVMVEDIIAAFETLHLREDVRAVIVTGSNGTFCSGGDLSDVQNTLTDETQMLHVARIDTMLRLVHSSPQVVIARVEGSALGGGFGLVCVSDIAVATTDAWLGMPEVRLGLIPAVIAPYVIRRIGLPQARRLMLMGARFDGTAARVYGVVHDAVPPHALDNHIERLLEDLRLCAPSALRACKLLLSELGHLPPEDTVEARAQLLNALRGSAEAREGLNAFREKRRASWAE